jgi:hypothetical protein
MKTRTGVEDQKETPFNPLSTVITGLAVWLIVSTVFLFMAVSSQGPAARAVMWMVVGLLLLWVLVFGALARTYRDWFRKMVLSIPWDWRVKFVVFAVMLALLEEAVTTGMTNLAPLFGSEIGAAYITASTNYFDVILFHSVIVFIPMFAVWAWMLSRWDFSPAAVFLLFGITGTLAEVVAFGPQSLAQFSLWIFVYGLMLYLPAYSLPERQVRKPARYLYLLAILLPLLAAVPVALIVGLLHPTSIHFPPIGG